jgi:hypothetical protein
MTLDIQFKIKNNDLYKEYLRENSEWYKVLNRNPGAFKEFEENVKIRYGLRPTDKINKFIDTAHMISTLVSSLK